VVSFDQAHVELTKNYPVRLLQITERRVGQAARLEKRNRTDFCKLRTKPGLEPVRFKQPS